MSCEEEREIEERERDLIGRSETENINVRIIFYFVFLSLKYIFLTKVSRKREGGRFSFSNLYFFKFYCVFNCEKDEVGYGC